MALIQIHCSYINKPPKIETITVTPDSLGTYDRAVLRCVASDGDNDPLNYRWKARYGTFVSGSKSDSAVWQAPSIPGLYYIRVVVSDDYDLDMDSIAIQVDQFFNMISIPPDSFTYGEGDTLKVMNQGFSIMKYEVTNQQYAKYLEEALTAGEIALSGSTLVGYYTGDENYGANYYTYIDLSDSASRISMVGPATFTIDPGYSFHPVVAVSWFGALAFADHYSLSLPTEQEWELAARGDRGYDYPWGDTDPTCEMTNYSGCRDDTQPVGRSSGVSPYGLYDMSGNVWEWTADWYNDSLFTRVRRGGGYNNFGDALKSWFRYHSDPTGYYEAVGFRCIKRE
ncbi:MAG: formylglycine-generating enzyme family protein [Fidelibacterota bacterium]